MGQDNSADRMVGRVIRENIRIEEVIGAGAMGTVYRGVQTNLDRPVAVKVLHPLKRASARVVDYFLSEARLLSSLRHPNLAWVVDFGQDEVGGLFLVMEYIPGRSLGALIDAEAPLPPRRAARILLQLLAALEVVHEAGIVHRDLKPDNVLIEEIAGMDDYVKLLDFGVAEVFEREPDALDLKRSPEGPEIFGTPEYMAPEQALEDHADARADVYAAGVIFYELITGQLPFTGQDVVALLTAKVSHEPPTPSQLRYEIPPHWDDVVLRALARHPDQRYPSVTAFREAVEAALRGPDAAASVIRLDQPGAALAVLAGGAPPGDVGRESLGRAWAILGDVATSLGGRVEEIAEGALVVWAGDPSHAGRAAALAALECAATLRRRLPWLRLQAGLCASPDALTGRGAATERTRAEARALARDASPGRIRLRLHNLNALWLRDFATLQDNDGLEILGPAGVPTSAEGLDAYAATLGLVGQQHARHTVEDAVLRVAQGERGAALMLTGPPGCGRTALTRWAAEVASLLGVPTLEACCHNRLLDRPFRPLLEWLVTLEVTRGVEAAWPEEGGSLDEALRLAGLPDGPRALLVEQATAQPRTLRKPFGPTSAELLGALHRRSPRDRGLEMRAALREALRCLTRGGGLVLVLDDLHQADAGTAACIPALVALTRELPILLLTTGSRVHTSWARAGVEELPLAPLQPDERRALLGDEHAPPDVLDASQGSPLYLASWRRWGPFEPTPQDLPTLVVAAMEALNPGVKRLLAVCCALGEYFEGHVLRGLFPESGRLGEALEQAAALGWVERCAGTGEVWRFTNPMLRRALYDHLGPEGRLRYHLQIFERLLQHQPQTVRLPLLLATHGERGDLGWTAVDWMVRVADRFAFSGDVHVAAYWYRLALKAARRGGPRAPRPEQLAEVLLKAAHILLLDGDAPSAEALLQHAAIAHPDHIALRSILRARAALAAQDPDAALQAISAGVAQASASSLLAPLLHLTAEAKQRLGLHHDAVNLLRELRFAFQQGSIDTGRGFSFLRAEVEALLGEILQHHEPAEAAALLRGGLALALADEDAALVGRIMATLTRFLLQSGDHDGVLTLCERVGQSAAAWLRPVQRVNLALLEADALHAAHRDEEARQRLARAALLAAELGWEEMVDEINKKSSEMDSEFDAIFA